MTGLVLRSDEAAIATLTLSNPEKLNALSMAMLEALGAELERLRGDRSIRAVILCGAGRAFCAGHDLRELSAARQAEDAGRGFYEALFKRCSEVMLAITRLPQPVIAEVRGIATAAGCQLVATCDMAVAAETARFGVNGVNIGLFCSTPMVALTRNVPAKFAFEMLTTGEFISAARAAEIGLVNRSVPEAGLAAATRELAGRIAGKLAAAVRIGKEAFYAQAALPLAEAYAYAGAVMTENMLRDDTAEGVAAFIDKREPSWRQ
ncbi:MAG TPA: enoyl-CoA hydratase [Paracoccaceae bacterium]|nr:enoyl-CoA hydratase [Paracoccaceae bacterium]